MTWLPPDPTIPAFPPAIPRGYPRRVARDNCPRSGPPPSRAHTPQMRQRHLPVGHTRQRAVVSDTLAAAPARPRAHPAPPAPAGLALAVVCASSGKARRRLSASLPPMPPAHIGTGILCNACFHAAASCRAYRTTRIPWITRPPSALGRPPPTLDHDPAAGWITPWLPVKHGPHGNQTAYRAFVPFGGIARRLRRRESGDEPTRRSHRHGRRRRLRRNGWGAGWNRRR